MNKQTKEVMLTELKKKGKRLFGWCFNKYILAFSLDEIEQILNSLVSEETATKL